MKTKIVILQTSYYGQVICEEALKNLGLTYGQDFRCVGGSEEVLKYELMIGQRQLLITGSFSGNTEPIPEFIRRARALNTELVCMSFSIVDLDGPFDYRIAKDGGKTSENFQNAVKGFLEGTINRVELAVV